MNSSLHDAGQARKSFRAASSASSSGDTATSVDTPANQESESPLASLFRAAKLDLDAATPVELTVVEYCNDCDDVVGGMLVAASDDLAFLAEAFGARGDAQSERILDRISNRLTAAAELYRRQVAVAS